MPIEEPALPDLVEALRLEQQQRWQEGNRVVVESYLTQHPRLRTDQTGVLHLVYNEILLREAAGDNPRLEEYVERFPQLGDQLNPLFEVHRALGSDQLLSIFGDQLPQARTPLPTRSLLEMHDAQGPSATEPMVTKVAEQPGAVIGSYKLLQQIGEGGFGVVFMAEQSHPVQRKVALKLIKPGMDSRQVIARFEAERQALAIMDHPNIARVYDGGITLSGRPYFVMELVKGVPITRYCDEHHLTPRERLELFVPVCQAVQHAHQKGIIHRDLKPSNVMVCIYDGKPVPKIIDFGVAKATASKLTERTLYTEFGAIVGTLEYMSPEQAQLDQLDIDTRSDIYSLGVLLYELLTGTTPFQRKQLRQTKLDEMLRLIREQEPPTPSTRLSTTAELPAIAVNRGLEPRKLTSLVRGELDWIVMKALDKDRNRRYETANELARDIERYLHNEPVEACPPSTAYRLRKFAAKNKNLLTVAGAFALLLVAGATISTWQAVRATLAEKRAETSTQEARTQADISQAVNDFLNHSLLGQASPELTADRDLKVRTLLDRAATKIEGKFPQQPLVEAAIRATLGRTYEALGEYEHAEQHWRRGHELYKQTLGPEHRQSLSSMAILGQMLMHLARLEEARQLEEEAVSLQQRFLGPEDPDTLWSMNCLAWVLDRQGRFQEADKLLQELLPLRRRILGPEHLDTLRTMHLVTVILYRQGRFDECLKLDEELLSLQQRILGAEHPDTLTTRISLASVLGGQGRFEEARCMDEELLPLCRRILGPEHDRTIAIMGDLAWAFKQQGRLDEARALYDEMLRLRRRLRGPEHTDTLQSMHDLALVLADQGRLEEACKLHEETLGLRRRLLGAEHPDTLWSMHILGRVLTLLGRLEEARQLLEQVVQTRLRTLGIEHGETVGAMRELVVVLRQQGRLDDVRKLSQQIVAQCTKAIDRHLKSAWPLRERAGAYRTLGQDDKAIDDYSKAIAQEPKNAGQLSSLAYLYATSRDPQIQDAGKAVALAKQAVELAPNEGNNWNTLGVAHYRAGDWKGAIEALAKSNEMLKGQQVSFNALFLAMAHWRLGNSVEARKRYDQAVAWMEKNKPQGEELRRFRAEAQSLLKIEEKAMPNRAVREGATAR
jgi:serine/threonine protein kinase